MTNSRLPETGLITSHADFPERLSNSQMYREYEQAFTQASGLPLILKDPRGEPVEKNWTGCNAFCELMAQSNPCRTRCLFLQKKLEHDSQTEARTVECFAGMYESAVPVRIENRTVAFLQTGHVFPDKPGRVKFSKLSRQLLDLGIKTDLQQIEQAWLATPALPRVRYDAFVRMLQIFARHIEMFSAELGTHPVENLPPSIQKTRQLILDRCSDELSLTKAAQMVNLSTHHLCKLFKQSMGLSFVEFVTKVRVEKACQLLRHSGRLVSEAGYEAGFQSLSQFNRAFKKLLGCSPTEYRGNHAREGHMG